MNLLFEKWEGSGNDFVLLKQKEEEIDQELVRKLCHRRYGIGADGVLIVQDTSFFSFSIYNADGSRAAMCGNGLRCVAGYLLSKHNLRKALIHSDDMIHECFWQKDLVAVEIRVPKEIHTLPDLKKNCMQAFLINSGVPHLILLSQKIPANWIDQARTLRHHPLLGKEGANVSFVDMQQRFIRTYERGVEAETYSCGTAAVAAAFALNRCTNEKDFHLRYPHDALNVSLEINSAGISRAILCGKARKVFSGEWHLMKKTMLCS